MATGVPSDFTTYQDQFYSGLLDREAQNINAFNAASAGGITLIDSVHEGQYSQRAFFDRVSSLISRQDLTSSSAATNLNMTSDEVIGVKCHGKIGPVGLTRNQWKLIGENPSLFFFILGQQSAEEMQKYMLNFAVAAALSALGDQADLQYDATGQTTKTLAPEHLASGMSKRGDKGMEIATWVGYSLPFYGLMKNQMGLIADSLAGASIYNGSVGTLGRPFVMTDNPYLLNSGSPNTYYTLGLVPGGVTIEVSSPLDTNLEPTVSGYEQLLSRFQGEWAFTVFIKGCKWDTTVGANPTAANVAASGSWDIVTNSVKNMLGVRIETQ